MSKGDVMSKYLYDLDFEEVYEMYENCDITDEEFNDYIEETFYK